MNDTLLAKIDWSVGIVEAELTIQYRDFDVSEKSLLEFMSELVETYDCAITWDTVNKKVNFYKHENLGHDRGLSIEYGKYLKSINEEPDFDNVVTRLYPYGKDITIESVNPLGLPYIESLDYYKYPFKRDEQGNVIQSSNYMSDSLCVGLEEYEAKIASKSDEFRSLLDQQISLKENLTISQTELATLQTQLSTIWGEIDKAWTKNAPMDNLFIQQQNVQNQINSKQAEINNLSTSLSNVEAQISVLQSELAIENNFTPEQIIERNQFIKEMVWTDDKYTDPNGLFDAAKTRLLKFSQPRIAYKMNIVDFLKVASCKRDWSKLVLGDIVTVRYPNFKVDIKAKIIAIDHDEDSNSIHIEITNAQDIKNGFVTLKELFERSISTSSKINMSKYKWDGVETVKNDVNDLLQNKWDSAKREIVSGVNESVEINQRGITIADSDDPNRFIRMTHGVIGLSENGGNSYQTAIDASGVYAQRLIGQVVAGTNLTITNEEGNFLVNSNGVIVENADFKVTRSDDNSRIIMNANDGLKIQQKNSEIWTDKLYADTDGNLNITGNIQMTGGSIEWGSIAAPDYDKIGGSKPPSNADNTSAVVGNKLTKIDANGIYTGSLTAEQVNAVSIVADSISSGAIDGETITGATIRTSSNPNRVVMDSTGLHAYHSGVERVSIASTADQQTRAIYLRNSGGTIQGLIAHGSEFAGTGVYIAGNAQAGANAGYILIKDDGSVWAGNNGSSYRLDQTPNVTAKFG